MDCLGGQSRFACIFEGDNQDLPVFFRTLVQSLSIDFCLNALQPTLSVLILTLYTVMQCGILILQAH